MEEAKELKKEKSKLQSELKEINKEIPERQKVLMEIEILSKKAEEGQSLATLQKRILRTIDYSTDELKRYQTKLMQLIDEAWDIGDEARDKLIKEANFIKKIADSYIEKANQINKDATIEAEFEEI